MTLVVPLGKSAFEFFDKDRDVIHTFAIAIKQALDLSFSIRLLPIASDFLLEGRRSRGSFLGFLEASLRNKKKSLRSEVGFNAPRLNPLASVTKTG